MDKHDYLETTTAAENRWEFSGNGEGTLEEIVWEKQNQDLKNKSHGGSYFYAQSRAGLSHAKRGMPPGEGVLRLLSAF